MAILARSFAPFEVDLLSTSRRAVLATLAPDGRPRLVPISYAIDPESGVVYTPLDEKPKSVSDPRELGRVRDIRARPEVCLIVDRWSENWSELAWLRLDGRASLLEPGDEGHDRSTRLLRDKYPQYADHALESRPVIRIEVERATGWSAAG